LVARIIDGAIDLAIFMPFFFATGIAERYGADQVTFGEEVALFTSGLALHLVLHGFFLATRGQTIGKLIMGIQIVDYHTGELLSLWKLFFMRDFVIGMLGLIPIGGLIGLVNVLMIFGEEKRCVHDHLAGTKVVNRMPTPP